ncbi:hypothetical protein ACT7DF_02060 [Bacillus cereus]
MAGGFWLLTTMDMHTTKLTATSYMMVIGLGMGLVMPTLTLALQEKLPEKRPWCRNVIKSVLPSNWWNIWYYNFRINYE